MRIYIYIYIYIYVCVCVVRACERACVRACDSYLQVLAGKVVAQVQVMCQNWDATF